MSNETIFNLIIVLIACTACFLAGYYFGKARRLERDNELREDDGNSITRATERINSSEGRVEDIKSATESVLNTIRKYESTASENKELE